MVQSSPKPSAASSSNAPPSAADDPKQTDVWRKSVVKKTVSFLESEFGKVIRDSSYLKSGTAKAVPLFHRTEIVVGPKLGKGGFAEVYAIQGFDLRDDISSQLSQAQREARQKMAEGAVVNGKCRYAIKHLQGRLMDKPKEFQRAAADLVNEAAFLAVLDHPNILALEGLALNGMYAYSDGMHDSFFIITERLNDTLWDKMRGWLTNPSQEPLLDRKIDMARQLADALQYLHQRRIVFRDLKPSNLGFSFNNDGNKETLKLFDFGLSRELPRGKGNANEVFNMSGVGTRRYMACEVVKGLPYNCKVDVYSWSMIFWQMLSLTKPFAEYDDKQHKNLVCTQGDRPPLSSQLPKAIQSLLQLSWTSSVHKRLTMADVCRRLAIIHKEVMKDADSSSAMTRVSVWNSPTWTSRRQHPVKRVSSSSLSTASLDSSSNHHINSDGTPSPPNSPSSDARKKLSMGV